MTPAVAAVLADRPLATRLALVVAPASEGGSCATSACERDHAAGRRYCDPCRTQRDLDRRRRWWAKNGQTWRDGRRAAA